MACKQCASGNQRVFNAEIAIHFPGLEGLNKAIVWVFTKPVVCLHCGFAESSVPDRSCKSLRAMSSRGESSRCDRKE